VVFLSSLGQTVNPSLTTYITGGKLEFNETKKDQFTAKLDFWVHPIPVSEFEVNWTISIDGVEQAVVGFFCGSISTLHFNLCQENGGHVSIPVTSSGEVKSAATVSYQSVVPPRSFFHTIERVPFHVTCKLTKHFQTRFQAQ
jgi:hypothetical protein